MKFKELLEVLHPYTDINIWIEHDDTMTLFETSKPGLLAGNHKDYYDEHKDWDVDYAYPDHSDIDGNHMIIKITDKPKHICYFDALSHDNSRFYCLKCGNSIPNPYRGL